MSLESRQKNTRPAASSSCKRGNVDQKWIRKRKQFSKGIEWKWTSQLAKKQERTFPATTSRFKLDLHFKAWIKIHKKQKKTQKSKKNTQKWTEMDRNRHNDTELIIICKKKKRKAVNNVDGKPESKPQHIPVEVDQFCWLTQTNHHFFEIWISLPSIPSKSQKLIRKT